MIYFVFIFLILSGIFLFSQSIEAYPAYQAVSEIVEAGGYPTIETGSANWGSSHLNSYFLSFNNLFKIRQDGVIDHFAMYFYSKPVSLTTFYIQIWRRKENGLFDRIYSENVLSQITGGQICNLTPSTSWVVKEGDYIGYGFESSSAPNSFMLGTTGYTNVSTYIILDTAPSTTDVNWTGSTTNYTAAPTIKVYMSAPQIAFIGDSIIAGGPNHAAYTYDRLLESRTTTLEYQLSSLTSYIYQNMGKGSDTTTGINSRFTTDVINLKPKIVVIEGGVNDIAGAVAKSTVIANWTSMLNAAQADSNITTIILLKILPWTNGTNTQMQTRDDWNASLVALVGNYSKAIIVDTSSYVGQFRAGGDTGNLWDIKTAYNADGVHFTDAGYGQIAQAIADSLPKPSAIFDNDFSAWNRGNITVNYNLIQTGGSANTNISQTDSSGIEYSTDGTTWHDTTKGTGGDALTGLISTASPGTDHSFVWDSATDLPTIENSTVYLRIRSNDGVISATDWVVSNAFKVDNFVRSTGLAQSFFNSPIIPEGGFKMEIDNGTLTLTAGEDTKQMEIADNPDFYLSTGKIPFQFSYPWAQSSGTVYARFFTDSQYGSPSQTVSAIITPSGETPVQPTEPTKTPQEITRETILQSMVEVLQQIIQLYIQLLSL